MTDREKLLIALLSVDDKQWHRGVTVLEVVSMLYELGAEHRQRTDEGLVLAGK